MQSIVFTHTRKKKSFLGEDIFFVALGNRPLGCIWLVQCFVVAFAIRLGNRENARELTDLQPLWCTVTEEKKNDKFRLKQLSAAQVECSYFNNCAVAMVVTLAECHQYGERLRLRTKK